MPNVGNLYFVSQHTIENKIRKASSYQNTKIPEAGFHASHRKIGKPADELLNSALDFNSPLRAALINVGED